MNQSTDNQTPKLLAPNGEPTNLSPELYAYVRTPEFKQWFGDWMLPSTRVDIIDIPYENGKKVLDHSHILDENGEPLVLYRGQMSHANVPFVNHGDGIYFTPDREAAMGYGIDHNPIPVFLNAHNPYEVDFDGDSDMEDNDYHGDIKAEYHYAESENFDILIATNTFDGENILDQYVVHNDAQVRRIDTLNLKEIIANASTKDIDDANNQKQENNMSYQFNNLIREPHTPLTNNDIMLRDKLIDIMQNAGIAVNTNWQEGQAILDQANSQVKFQNKEEKGQKKTTTSERSGAVAGNSSSDSLNFDTKERLSRHPFGVQNLDAKILQNTEITKSRIKKIINQGDFSVKSQNPSEITRHINKRLRLDKSKSSQSYYGDYYEGDFNIGEERTVRVRLSTHPATGERLGNAPTDDKISLVVYKNGEHHTTGQGYGEYSEWIYDPQKMSGEQIARQIINGIDNLLNNGEYIDPTISPVIYPSTETAQIIAQAQANGTYLKAPNGEDTTLQQKQWAQVRTDAFKNWFGDWQNGVIFTANNVDDIIALKVKYPSTLPNKYYHHSTNKYGKQTFDPREGKKERLHIIGRLTTEKVDCLLVENPNSNNKYPHITLATAKGIKHFESNTEIAKHQDMIQPLDDYVDTTFRNNISRDVSKLIDKNGEPMVLYHGTNTEFYTFKQKEGVRYTIGIPIDVKSQGFFLTDNKDLAEDFARSRHRQNNEEGKPQVMDAYVSMKKPADLSELTNESEELFYKIAGFWPAVTMGYETIDKWWQIADDEEIDIDARLKELGYDGIIFAEEIDEDGKTVAKSYFVTNPNQIKSATLNNGEFSLENNDIRFQLANSSSLSPQATAVSERPSQQPIFISNALLAIQKINQQKATPQQWLGMIQNLNGIKPGEDRWTGLSDWLRNNEERLLTKQQVLDYIAEHQIQINETYYMNVEDTPQFANLYDEFVREINNAEDLYDEAFEEYADSLDKMKEKYGQNFDYEHDLTKEEREEGEELLEIRKPYNTQKTPSRNTAFNLMAEKYGKNFEEAFDYDGDILFIADENKAAEFLDINVKQIDDTRLRYSTENLDNKKEIALTVPNIESWDPQDYIHFGDADNGRTIAWARFGDATYLARLSEKEIQERIEKRPAADQWIKTENIAGYEYANEMFLDPNNRKNLVYTDEEGKYHIEFNSAPNNWHELDNNQIRAARRVGDTFDTLKEAVAAYDEYIVRCDSRSERVLVIDEIQSKRHQNGREKGYKKESFDSVVKEVADNYSVTEERVRNNPFDVANAIQKYDPELAERLRTAYSDQRSPAAPFENNWHELVMKRMLRYAAENDYDRIAWTTGEQQTNRYDLSKFFNEISVVETMSAENLNDYFGNDCIKKDGKVMLLSSSMGDDDYSLAVDEEGTIIYCHETEKLEGKKLNQLVGKALADKLLEADHQTFSGENIRIGGEGMTAFYDHIIPNFVNKYAKKWNAHTEDVFLPDLNYHGITMHSVPVTPQMKQDVMQGQLMFFLTNKGDAYGFTKDNTIYIDPRIATSETPIHEYAHLWAQAIRQYNQEEWQNIVQLMKQVKPVWEMVQSQYSHLSSDSDIAEEVLAQYSGKQGLKNLEKALKYFNKDLSNQEAQNILERIKAAIDRFWQKTADFLHIHYNSADEVAERVMHDLLNQVNPQLLAQQLNANNGRGDLQSHNQTLTQPHSILAYSTAPYADVQTLAHGVKDGDSTAIKEAARRMADIIGSIPEKNDFVLVPMPSHEGYATYTKTLAEEITKLTGIPTKDILTAQPHTPLYDYKKVNGMQNLPLPSLDTKEDLPENKIPLIIDNVLDTGTSAFAAAHAVNKNSNARIAVLGNTDNFYQFHNGITLESERLLNQNANINFQLIGEKGVARLDSIDHKGRIENLHVAREMERANRTPKEIKIATGWERGADRKWRYETSDAQLNPNSSIVEYIKLKTEFLRLNEVAFNDTNKRRRESTFRKADRIRQKYLMIIPKEKKIGEIINNDAEILKAYPEIADIKLKVINEPLITTKGSYNEKDNSITLNMGHLKYEDDIRSTLLHEIQHFIQNKEGFAQGANIDQQIPEAILIDIEEEMAKLHNTIEQKKQQLKNINDKLPELQPLLDRVHSLVHNGIGSNEMVNALLAVERFRHEHREETTMMERLRKEVNSAQKRVDELNEYIEQNRLGENYYRQMAGEVESRNVQSRMLRNQEINARTTAESTEDVPRNEQIIIFSNPHHVYGENQNTESPDIIITRDSQEKNDILNTQYIKSEDNPHVGYSKTISDGGARGKEHLERNIFYDDKPIGFATATIKTGEGNPFVLLNDDAYKETFLLDVPVSPYDRAKDAWEGIGDKELDGFYDYGCMQFKDEQLMIDFYEAHRQVIDYRNERYELIRSLAETDRDAAEQLSITLPVNQVTDLKPVQEKFSNAQGLTGENMQVNDKTEQKNNITMPTDQTTKPNKEILDSSQKIKELAAQRDYLQEFLDSKTKMQALKAEQNLGKLVSFNMPDKTNRVMTNAEFIQYALDKHLEIKATQEKGNFAASKVEAIERAFHGFNENIIKRELGSYYKDTPEMKAFEQLLQKMFHTRNDEKPSSQEYHKASKAAIDSIIDANTPKKTHYHVQYDSNGTYMSISKTMYDYAAFIQTNAIENLKKQLTDILTEPRFNEWLRKHEEGLVFGNEEDLFRMKDGQLQMGWHYMPEGASTQEFIINDLTKRTFNQQISTLSEAIENAIDKRRTMTVETLLEQLKTDSIKLETPMTVRLTKEKTDTIAAVGQDKPQYGPYLISEGGMPYIFGYVNCDDFNKAVDKAIEDGTQQLLEKQNRERMDDKGELKVITNEEKEYPIESLQQQINNFKEATGIQLEIKDGKPYYTGNLDLFESNIHRLPDNLTVEGSINLNNTHIQQLPKGLTVKEDLVLENTNVERLPDDLKIGRNLSLYNTPIKELPENLTVKGHLDLSDTPIKELPEKLSVEGNLWLDASKIERLPDGLKVGGSLGLYYTQIKELPENITVEGSLGLSFTQITELPENLTVGRSLWLEDTPIERLPENLTVGGDLWLGGSKIEQLPEGLKVEGSLGLSYTPIKELPKGLTVGDSLWLENTPIEKLPEGLTVGGYLDLRYTPIKELPENLTVDGWLNIRNTAIKELPADLKVKETIYMNEQTFEATPDVLTPDGYIDLVKAWAPIAQNTSPLAELQQQIADFKEATGIQLEIKDNKPYYNGNLDLTNANVKELPEGLKVKGNLLLADSHIKELPEKLTVKGNLDLSSSDIERLPEGLQVGGGLSLSYTSIEELPEGLNVKGDLLLRGSKIEKLPENLTVGGTLDLRNTPIKELPDNLTVVGNLWLNSSKIERLPDGLTVGGDLNLSNTQIKELPENLTVGGDLLLYKTPIEKLPEGLQVGRSLGLSYTNIKELPEGLTVGDSIYLEGSKIERLPEGLYVGGDLSLDKTPIERLPDKLSVEGSLWLGGSKIERLPEGLEVDCSLDLSDTPIKELPEGLKVEGWLDLHNTPITKLPKGLTVEDDLILHHSKIERLPEGLAVGGSLDLSNTQIKELPADLKVKWNIVMNEQIFNATSKNITPDGYIDLAKAGAPITQNTSPSTEQKDEQQTQQQIERELTKTMHQYGIKDFKLPWGDTIVKNGSTLTIHGHKEDATLVDIPFSEMTQVQQTAISNNFHQTINKMEAEMDSKLMNLIKMMNNNNTDNLKIEDTVATLYNIPNPKDRKDIVVIQVEINDKGQMIVTDEDYSKHPLESIHFPDQQRIVDNATNTLQLLQQKNDEIQKVLSSYLDKMEDADGWKHLTGFKETTILAANKDEDNKKQYSMDTISYIAKYKDGDLYLMGESNIYNMKDLGVNSQINVAKNVINYYNSSQEIIKDTMREFGISNMAFPNGDTIMLKGDELTLQSHNEKNEKENLTFDQLPWIKQSELYKMMIDVIDKQDTQLVADTMKLAALMENNNTNEIPVKEIEAIQHSPNEQKENNHIIINKVRMDDNGDLKVITNKNEELPIDDILFTDKMTIVKNALQIANDMQQKETSQQAMVNQTQQKELQIKNLSIKYVNDEWRLSANIDGKQMRSVPIAETDVLDYKHGIIDKQGLVNKAYGDNIGQDTPANKQEEKRSKGRGR